MWASMLQMPSVLQLKEKQTVGAVDGRLLQARLWETVSEGSLNFIACLSVMEDLGEEPTAAELEANAKALENDAIPPEVLKTGH